MKKFFLALVMCISALSASAQIDLKSVDVKANLRGDFGIGAGITMGLFDHIDFSPNVNYYFSSGANLLSIDADFHYNIDLGYDLNLYPMAGLVIAHWGASGPVSGTTKLGLNLGCGLDYDLNRNWSVFAEAKYQFLFSAGGADDTFFSLGAKYRF